MKTLIIGHKSGIGKAIALSIDEYLGLSKSTGFDINETHDDFDYNQFDCIILNAYDKFNSQLETMFEIVEQVSKNTLIIVVASTSAYKTNPSDFYWAKYSIEKAAIIKAGIDLNTMGYNIAIISPGTVDTHRNNEKNCNKLSTQSIANVALDIIDKFNYGILLEHTVIRTVKE